jgi:hypothetical protein
MLLSIVFIGALSIPQHISFEKWTTQEVLEKYKSIRLANVQKTSDESHGKH